MPEVIFTLALIATSVYLILKVRRDLVRRPPDTRRRPPESKPPPDDKRGPGQRRGG